MLTFLFRDRDRSVLSNNAPLRSKRPTSLNLSPFFGFLRRPLIYDALERLKKCHKLRDAGRFERNGRCSKERNGHGPDTKTLASLYLPECVSLNRITRNLWLSTNE